MYILNFYQGNKSKLLMSIQGSYIPRVGEKVRLVDSRVIVAEVEEVMTAYNYRMGEMLPDVDIMVKVTEERDY